MFAYHKERCQRRIMSPSELLLRTGLSVSTRQFRRYMVGGLIPGVVRRKRGHYVVIGPVTPARITRIRENIIKFRCKPGRKKLKFFPPVQKKKETRFSGRFPPWNLYTSMVSFLNGGSANVIRLKLGAMRKSWRYSRNSHLQQLWR